MKATSMASRFAVAAIEAGLAPEQAVRLTTNEAVVAALAKEGADPEAIARAVATNQPIPEPVNPAAYFDSIREAATPKGERPPSAAERLRIRRS